MIKPQKVILKHPVEEKKDDASGEKIEKEKSDWLRETCPEKKVGKNVWQVLVRGKQTWT